MVEAPSPFYVPQIQAGYVPQIQVGADANVPNLPGHSGHHKSLEASRGLLCRLIRFQASSALLCSDDLWLPDALCQEGFEDRDGPARGHVRFGP